MSDDRPINSAERRVLRLIIGEAFTPPDNVIQASAWCREHGAEIQHDDTTGRYYCRRGAEVLATAMDLGVLLGKLERLNGGQT